MNYSKYEWKDVHSISSIFESKMPCCYPISNLKVHPDPVRKKNSNKNFSFQLITSFEKEFQIFVCDLSYDNDLIFKTVFHQIRL